MCAYVRRSEWRLTSTALAVDGRKGHEGAAEDNQIGKGQGQTLPVDREEHGDVVAGNPCELRGGR